MAANIPLWHRRAKQAEKNADKLIEKYIKKYGHNFTKDTISKEDDRKLMYWLKAAKAAYTRIVNDEVKRGVIKLKQH